jgi:hypothetical protein
VRRLPTEDVPLRRRCIARQHVAAEAWLQAQRELRRHKTDMAVMFQKRAAEHYAEARAAFDAMLDARKP